MNSPPSPFPLELNYDQQHKLFISKPPQSSSSSSSFSNPIVLNPPQDHRGELKQLHNDQEAHNFFPHGGSCDDPITLKDESYNGLKLTIWSTKESRSEMESETSSVKWMPSKMRMMRKMISSDRTGSEKFEDQKQPLPPPETDNNSSTNTTVRVCSDCNTTKTPLWRSGPRGPKSLCNACGIRQRKARRAMAAAAAAANGTILAANPPSIKSKVKHSKEKRSSSGYVPKLKKKCKLTNPSSHGRDQKLCLEDFTISLSKNSAFQRVFPQDEKEAAILLMALSYGLVHG